MGGMETGAQTAQPSVKKRKANKTSFGKKNRANPYGAKGKPPPPKPEGLKPRPGETQLEAMRWVMANDRDETFLQWDMREWKRTQPKDFYAAKLTLERDAGDVVSSGTGTLESGAGGESVPIASVVEMSPGRAELLIEQLLKEWEGVK